jgi:hypothetical protein
VLVKCALGHQRGIPYLCPSPFSISFTYVFLPTERAREREIQTWLQLGPTPKKEVAGLRWIMGLGWACWSLTPKIGGGMAYRDNRVGVRPTNGEICEGWGS